ncbi:MAG: hypothetical protein C5B50_17260 [Verrucomicrobia bacterium]|nr:MAG: hypothetical protein C5B50_17260 [Verrucomicrobiota bacterium]
MFLATINKPKRLLLLSYIGNVIAPELEQGLAEGVPLLDDLGSGFRVLADFSQLDSMGVNCAPLIGKLMELAESKGVSLIVRVIPHPRKDIGLNILSLFHYRQQPQTVTCESMAEAARALGI